MEEIIFCKGGGCSAKLGAGALRHILLRLPKFEDENLLVGFNGSDDAAVYRLSDDIAMVSTLDFFPPMVKDPYIFGQIAAANALSDIYAMGGEVKTALNIVCFPENMDLNILGKILMGGSLKVKEAGGVIAGGHSIADSDIKYGLSVNGIINPSKVLKNNSCKEGDYLILTKPLGVGICCSADRLDSCPKDTLQEAIESMTTLNKYSAEILKEYNIHSLTDITGFGLLVHLSEMLNNEFSGIIYSKSLPIINGALDLADEFFITGAGQRNRNFIGDKVDFNNIDFPMEELLFDPQTSGGLLCSLPKEDAIKAIVKIKDLGIKAEIIGKIISPRDKLIYVEGSAFND